MSFLHVDWLHSNPWDPRSHRPQQKIVGPMEQTYVPMEQTYVRMEKTYAGTEQTYVRMGQTCAGMEQTYVRMKQNVGRKLPVSGRKGHWHRRKSPGNTGSSCWSHASSTTSPWRTNPLRVPNHQHTTLRDQPMATLRASFRISPSTKGATMADIRANRSI